MSAPKRPFQILDVHGWMRRAQPLQLAWLEEVSSAATKGFRTRQRGLRSRGEISLGQARSIQLRPAAATERSISALIETGWRASSTLRSGIVDGPRPDVIVCHDAGIETIAAAAALNQADVSGARLLLHLRPDALLLAVTPFGRQTFNRLDASFRKVGGSIVLILVRTPAQARLARAAGLPAAIAPVPLPTSLNTEMAPTIDRTATEWPELDAAFEQAGLGLFSATTPDQAQVAAEAVAALQPVSTDLPGWTQHDSAADWLEYLHALGNLRSGAWLKQFKLGEQPMTMTAP
ncbi:MAG: hypothetical protein J0L52_12905 [Caulobacterales bacterium]|nr:hypothetical protein [Caulobacterales bacterium]